MGINIKLPIGLLFLILGILLTIFGLATISDPGMYAKSLGININLWTGLAMMVVALVLLGSLFFERKALKRALKDEVRKKSEE